MTSKTSSLTLASLNYRLSSRITQNPEGETFCAGLCPKCGEFIINTVDDREGDWPVICLECWRIVYLVAMGIEKPGEIKMKKGAAELL